jgi:hypothetical protein
MSTPEQDANRIVIRSGLVADFVEQTVLGMKDCGLNPAEGITAAEMIMWVLVENALKLSPNEMIQAASKAQAARMMSRLLSRVEAWPADTSMRS